MKFSCIVLSVVLFAVLFGCVLATATPKIGRRCFRGNCPVLPPTDHPTPICYWSTELIAAPTSQISAPTLDVNQNINDDNSSTMSIIAHVHLPDPTFEERILLNISSSNCQMVVIDTITPNHPPKKLEWLGIADLKTTHQGAVYCEAAPSCSIELHSALLTGFPLTESGILINSGENFYMDYNYTSLEICEGWILQADMQIKCNQSTSDNSFCKFMFGTECPSVLPQDVSPTASPLPSNSEVQVPEVVIIPDNPTFPGNGGVLSQFFFPQVHDKPNNRRVM